MATKTHTILGRLIGLYLLIGAAVCLFLVLRQLSLGIYFSFLLPVVMTLIIFIVIAVAGFRQLYVPASKFSQNLVFVSLLIMSFQVFIEGFAFANYFGPYLGLGFRDAGSFSFIAEFQALGYRALNGYKLTGSGFYVVVNVFPLLLIALQEYYAQRRSSKDFNIIADN